MADKKDLIDPINATFDEVVGSVTPKVDRKEIGKNSRKIKHLAPVYGGKEITSDQEALDLGIERERSVWLHHAGIQSP